MEKRKYKITDTNGIHARPAGIIVKCAKEFDSAITFHFGDKTADAKKLFSLMQLGVSQGDEVEIQAEGTDEKKAILEVENTMKSAGL